MTASYRQPGEVVADEEEELSENLGERLRRIKRQRDIALGIALVVNVINLIYQLIYLAMKYW